MPDTTCHMSISLDGFVAGPDQSREDPLGKRGRELHAWHLGDERANDADATAIGWLMRPRGAYVMGRNMFGPIRGEWDEDWRGWWGPEPPYHAPVFVLTHHAHEPIEMEGGTTFHFVTDGFDAAYAQARETAGEGGVDIAGGASTVRQALIAGVVDELTLAFDRLGMRLRGTSEDLVQGLVQACVHISNDPAPHGPAPGASDPWPGAVSPGGRRVRRSCAGAPRWSRRSCRAAPACGCPTVARDRRSAGRG